ncbi:MAG: ROK family protein [Spirochaetales bacterium]
MTDGVMHKDNRYYICVEIGGTNTRTALIDKNCTVQKFDKVSTILLAEAKDKVAYFKSLIDPYVDMVGKENVIAISMTLTSLLDPKRRYVYCTPMIEGMSNLALADELQNLCNIPVVLEQDVNTLMLYELHKITEDCSGITAGFFLGTGLGNALAIDGKVYIGHSGSSGELGHMTVPGIQEICGCGKKGCWEFKASGLRLEAIANELNCNIKKIFVTHLQSPEVQELILYFAYAISYELAILDPTFAILSGGILSMEGFPTEELIKLIKENLRFPNPRESLKIFIGTMDDEAGVVGAALNAKSKGFM